MLMNASQDERLINRIDLPRDKATRTKVYSGSTRPRRY